MSASNWRSTSAHALLLFCAALSALSTPSLGFQSAQTTSTLLTRSKSNFREQQSTTAPHSLLSRDNSRSHSQLFSSPIETNDQAKDRATLVSAQDDQTQQLTFLGIFSGVFIGSFAFLNLYNTLEVILPSTIFNPFYTILPCVLSSAFISAGIAHFALEDTFTSFVPPKGSWGGLWQVPSPGAESLGLTYEQYHSFWSGIAEVLVGCWLFAATLRPDLLPTFGAAGVGDDGSDALIIGASTIPAALMYLLTAAVTPANIYMYTHNPVVPRIPALPYPWGHAGRGLLQCALLAVFYKLTIHSIS